jgi:hypothetical protein
MKANLSQHVYDEEDANKPLLVKEARHIVEKRLRIGKDYFYKYIRPVLDKKPILPGGAAERIRKGDVETLCNLIRAFNWQEAKSIVERKDLL